MKFDQLGLSDTLLQAVEQSGYTTPTPIQEKAIPAILEGRDVMAAAQTGTGKTAGFTLPLLEKLASNDLPEENSAYVLVLTPTRELAAQVQDSIRTYGKNEDISSAVVFGGVNINGQKKALRKGVDILVATPGRLLDLYQQKSVNFSDIEVLVLDEADRMLDMGFIHDIRRIIKLLPEQRQNLMFSATFSSEIRTLAKTICNNPVEIDVAPRNSTVDAITQGMYQVEKGQKLSLLTALLKDTTEQVLVFSRTKHGADKIAKRLNKENINAAAIHGNKSQNQRTKALADFKSNRVQVLVATDIAARGIDIDLLPQVINFDLPQVAEDYVHRIGRTGRAGASGQALSLVSSDESKQLKSIERLIDRKIKLLTHNFTLQSSPAAESVQPGNRRADSRPSQGQPRKKSRSAKGQGQGQGKAQGQSNSGRNPKKNNNNNADFWKSFPSSMAREAGKAAMQD